MIGLEGMGNSMLSFELMKGLILQVYKFEQESVLQRFTQYIMN